VLHELGSKRAAGLDINTRCAGVIDALWLAKVLIDAGSHATIAVCCAERFEPGQGSEHGSFERVTDALYAAGAAAAIVTADAGNSIAAFSSLTNPNLAVHAGMVPIAGGTRNPLDESAARAGLQFWHSQLSMRDVQEIASYSAQADLYNYPNLLRQTGIDAVDFVACSPFYVQPQLEALRSLNIDPRRTLFTIPHLGHIGPADLLLILGIAVASGRRVGTRTIVSTRTPVYSNALGILSTAPDAGISVAGQGVDLALWS
jgi:3-oxoacyl-[acyl-carrier-protein] synthase III